MPFGYLVASLAFRKALTAAVRILEMNSREWTIDNDGDGRTVLREIVARRQEESPGAVSVEFAHWRT